MRLFEPLEIGHLKIDNRIAFAPTHMGQATNRGEVNDQVLCHYSARAKGGAGLIIVQAVGVTAKYGGSFANRMVFPTRLVQEIRRAVGDRFVIGYRLSGDEHVDGGLDLASSVQVAAGLEEAGIDYLHLSSGCYEAMKWIFPDHEGCSIVGIPCIQSRHRDSRHLPQYSRP